MQTQPAHRKVVGDRRGIRIRARQRKTFNAYTRGMQTDGHPRWGIDYFNPVIRSANAEFSDIRIVHLLGGCEFRIYRSSKL